jgi:hypothetical protein
LLNLPWTTLEMNAGFWLQGAIPFGTWITTGKILPNLLNDYLVVGFQCPIKNVVNLNWLGRAKEKEQRETKIQGLQLVVTPSFYTDHISQYRFKTFE